MHLHSCKIPRARAPEQNGGPRKGSAAWAEPVKYEKSVPKMARKANLTRDNLVYSQLVARIILRVDSADDIIVLSV